MTTKHPCDAVLTEFASGHLDDHLAILVSAHSQDCAHCCSRLEQTEKRLAEEMSSAPLINDGVRPDLSKIQDRILSQSDSPASPQVVTSSRTLSFKNKKVLLPKALQKAERFMTSWRRLGSISYSKVNIAGTSNLYFVHFEAGAKIAQHSHDGNEYAYVVAGSFRDQHSDYVTGDFACFGVEDSHHPYTDDPDGCLLLVSLEGPFVFSEGLPRVLNPFRKLFFKTIF